MLRAIEQDRRNVTVTATTRIRRDCIIDANAVVTRDTEPMSLYADVSARRLRNRIEVSTI